MKNLNGARRHSGWRLFVDRQLNERIGFEDLFEEQVWPLPSQKDRLEFTLRQKGHGAIIGCERIRKIVCAQPSVRGLHDMRTRSDSDRIFMELHVEMDASITLQRAHEIAESIEAAVGHEFPNADVMIHQDPAGLEENRLDTQIAGREARSQ